jgi:arylsulfatase A-like enzyme
VNDIVPTLLDLGGIAAPTEVDGVVQQRVDGISMRYSVDDAKAPTRKARSTSRCTQPHPAAAGCGGRAQPRALNMFRLKPVDDDVGSCTTSIATSTSCTILAATGPQARRAEGAVDAEARRNNVTRSRRIS